MYTKNEQVMLEYPALAIGQALKAEREKFNISFLSLILTDTPALTFRGESAGQGQQ